MGILWALDTIILRDCDERIRTTLSSMLTGSLLRSLIALDFAIKTSATSKHAVGLTFYWLPL